MWLAVYGKYDNHEIECLIKMPQSSGDEYLAVCRSPANICAQTHTHIYFTCSQLSR